MSMGCLLPQQCLGEEASTVCDSGDGYRAGGREWQVLESRKLYGKVRTKITAVAGARISICKSNSSTLGFSLGYCRTMWGFFVAASMLIQISVPFRAIHFADGEEIFVMKLKSSSFFF